MGRHGREGTGKSGLHSAFRVLQIKNLVLISFSPMAIYSHSAFGNLSLPRELSKYLVEMVAQLLEANFHVG